MSVPARLVKRGFLFFSAFVGFFFFILPIFHFTFAAEFNVGVSDVTGLISAINSANANGEADTINLTSSSPYTLNTMNNITHGANGLPLVTSEITINGNGATITRDASAPTFRFFEITPAGNLLLDNITITNGYTSENDYGGGAIINTGRLTVNNSVFSSNRARTGGGGAIWNGTLQIGDPTALTDITITTISDNHVSPSASGGGLHNRGNMDVNNSIISGNSSDNNGG